MNSYYYHFTNIENLTSILEKGLIPMNGQNCKLVGDSRIGTCVSFEIEGCVIFSARYWYKMMYLYNNEKIAREHLNNSVFLRFKTDILDQEYANNEYFSQIFSKSVIPADCLNLCYLQHTSGYTEIDRFKIMLYMMKKIKLPSQMELEEFPYKALVKKLYDDFKEDLANFDEKEYKLLDIPLSNLANQDLDSFPQLFKK